MLALLYTDEKSRNLERYIYIGTLFNFFIFILGSCYVDIVGLRLNVKTKLVSEGSDCLCLPSFAIKALSHCTQLGRLFISLFEKGFLCVFLALLELSL